MISQGREEREPAEAADFRVAHYSPGRLRVRLSQIQRDREFGRQLQEILGSIEGVRRVSAQQLTGSLLLEYDPEALDLHSLVALGQMLNLIPESIPPFPEASALSPDEADGALPLTGLQASAPLAEGVLRIGEAVGAAIQRGGQVAGAALHPRVALPAAAIYAISQELGVKAVLGVSPGLAAAWVLATILVRSRPAP